MELNLNEHIKVIEKKHIKCKLCDKPLKKFSKNADWEARELHKKCYKKMSGMAGPYKCPILNIPIRYIYELK